MSAPSIAREASPRPGGAGVGPSTRGLVTAGALLAALLGGWHLIAGAAAVSAGIEGASMLDAGQARGAFDRLTRAVEGAPLQSKPCVDLGNLAVQAMDDDAFRDAVGIQDPLSLARLAFLAYAEALDRQPGNPAAWAGLAELFRKMREVRLGRQPVDIEEIDAVDDLLPAVEDRLAVAAYRKAVVLEPSNFFHHAYLGNLYAERGLREEAIAEWSRSLEIMPDLSWHFYLPSRDLPEDLYAPARDSLARALETNPTVPREQVLRNLGDLADRAGEHEAALAAYERAAAEAEDPSLALYLEGQLLFGRRRCAEAEPVLMKAMEPETLQPHLRALGHTLIARCRTFAGDDASALEHLERARRVNPGAWYIASDLAGIYERLGRLEKAESEYRAAIRMAPRRAGAYTSLIGLYRRNRQIGKAIPLAEKLVDLFPDDPIFREQLDSLHRDLGLPETGGS